MSAQPGESRAIMPALVDVAPGQRMGPGCVSPPNPRPTSPIDICSCRYLVGALKLSMISYAYGEFTLPPREHPYGGFLPAPSPPPP